jgi:hypothetical protein
MKKFVGIITLIVFIIPLYGQSLIGYYKPKRHFSFRDLFGKIPSYEYLIVKSDSTYLYNSFWGSFEEQEPGTWRLFNDTLMLYPFNKNKDINIVDHSYEANQIDSITKWIRFRITDLRGLSLKGLKVNFFVHSVIFDKVTDINGDVYFNSSSFDSVIIYGDKYSRYQYFKIPRGLGINNNYIVELKQRKFLFKGNKIENIKGETIFRKK